MKAKSLVSVAFLLVSLAVNAQVPQLLNFQGRVTVNGTNFDGAGLFKFSLVNSNGSATFWSNDGTGSGGTEPGNAVSLAVSAGFYSVLLGDATQPNMTVIPATVFTNGDVRIRAWFNDGVNGSQILTPDQRIAAVGYAMVAAKVAYSTPLTRYLSIPAASFLPYSTGINYFDNAGVGRYANSGGYETFKASVFLPHEATVTGIKARVLDNSTTGSVQVGLWEINRDDIRGLLVLLATTAPFASSQPQTLTNAAPLSQKIDNIGARYDLEIVFNLATASLDIRDVLISYTVDNPAP